MHGCGDEDGLNAGDRIVARSPSLDLVRARASDEAFVPNHDVSHRDLTRRA